MNMKTKLFLIFLLALSLFSCNKKTEIFDYTIIPVKSGDKWGYVDHEGKFTINPQFDRAMLFTDGIACVSVDEKYGYIDNEGKYLINPTYKDATYFSEGLACVVLENGYPSFINKKGEIQFTLNNAERCRVFSEGLAAVLIKNKWGFIDKSGKIAIQPQFESVSDFSNGFSVIIKEIKGKKLRGFINKKGEIVINPQFDQAYSFFEGFALIKMNDKWGFIDEKGSIVINPQFEDANYFSEGLSLIKQGDNYGFIDEKGKIVINPQFKNAGPFQEELAVIQSSDEKYGYINKEGKFEINPQFEDAGSFNQGIAFIKIGDKYGFIDKTGKIIINPQFDEIYGWLTNNSSIESDYIDTESFINTFLKNTNQKMFRGISKETTLKSLIDIEHKGSKISEDGSYGVSINDEIIINEFSKITKLNYSFSKKIYSYTPQYSYSYYYGYYNTGDIKNYNFSALVSGIEITIELSDKAFNKSENIRKALGNKLSKTLNTQPVKIGEEETIENSTMVIKLSSEDDYLTSKIKIKIEFK